VVDEQISHDNIDLKVLAMNPFPSTWVAMRLGLISLVWLLMGQSVMAVAAPVADDTVIEALPAAGRVSAQERSLRQQLAVQPSNAGVAVSLAQILINRSRSEGDPRPAGQALAVLSPWSNATTAPIEVLMQRANAQQHLHDFQSARLNLEQLVKREPRHAQAWLTLATLHRLQGRYAASNQACAAVDRARESFYAQACFAENMGLQGQTQKARSVLQALAVDDGCTVDQRVWLLTTLAELEVRSKRNDVAEQAYKSAMLLSPRDAYAAVSYGDFLLQQNRAADAVVLLKDQARSDAVLLRLTWARQQIKAPEATLDLKELTERMSQDKLNPQERLGHAREHAMFALWIQKDPKRALELARTNLTVQREPVDLLLLAQAARAAQVSPQAVALKEVRQLKKELGLFDERLDALL
jgi:predicted Zn-dependent protease